MRQLRHLDLVSLGAHGTRLTGDEYRGAFSSLAQLESLRLQSVYGVDLLPYLAHAPALRTLVVRCGADRPDMAASFGAMQPSRDALQQLLAAAPLLAVRLAVATSIDKWRNSFCYSHGQASDLQREQLDEQWRELQRMAAEMGRVSVVDHATEAGLW
jgi:hypothetical protein